MTTIYEVEHLHQPGGWLSPGYVEVTDDGVIRSVSGTKSAGRPVKRLGGFGVPGLSNLHSHAFQRALAGRTEFVTAARAEDNLWTWRKEMYRLVDQLTPETYEAIAALVYLEMLQFGMTAVCEFHYVHHLPSGRAHANPAEMSDRLIAAVHSFTPALRGRPPRPWEVGVLHAPQNPSRCRSATMRIQALTVRRTLRAPR